MVGRPACFPAKKINDTPHVVLASGVPYLPVIIQTVKQKRRNVQKVFIFWAVSFIRFFILFYFFAKKFLKIER